MSDSTVFNLNASDALTGTELFYADGFCSGVASDVKVTANQIKTFVGGLAVGTTAVAGGTSGRVLYDNAGVLGELATTGSGSAVLSTSPALTTPALGVATCTTLNKVTVTPPATGATFTLADGKTLTVNNSLTLAGTDGSTLNIGAGGTLGSNAFSSTSYLPSAGGTLTSTLTITPPANTQAFVISGASFGTADTHTFIDISGTWNVGAANVAGTAFKLNMARISSSSASLVMDLQISGNSQFNVDAFGNVLVGGALTIRAVSGAPIINLGQRGVVGDITAASGSALSWVATSNPNTGTQDLFLYRDAANVLAQRNGTNAQTRRLYGTFTDAANYERFTLSADVTAATMRIQSEAAGTGTVRIIAIDGFSKAGAAAASDLPSGSWGLVHDTSGATTKLCYNDGGTLRTVALT